LKHSNLESPNSETHVAGLSIETYGHQALRKFLIDLLTCGVTYLITDGRFKKSCPAGVSRLKIYHAGYDISFTFSVLLYAVSSPVMFPLTRGYICLSHSFYSSWNIRTPLQIQDYFAMFLRPEIDQD
jgi:hypothetical protein